LATKLPLKVGIFNFLAGKKNSLILLAEMHFFALSLNKTVYKNV